MTPPVPPRRVLAQRYVLGPAVGRGQSTVFRARDRRLQREVAVKQVDVAAWEAFDPGRSGTLRARALREARALARVSSPQAVSVFDVVEEQGSLWLVMELVDAPSLRALVVRYGALGHRRAALIGLDVLAALAAAHATGVVHRDVKPSNVLVPRGGPAKLTDFGVASVRDEEQLTAPGMVVGSPSYMAPEQACGRPAGPAADLWALGAMLYFAVEGRAPFPGGSPVATATAVVHGFPRPQRRPGPLSPVIRRLLAKDPRRRPGVAAVRRELAAIAYRPDIGDRRAVAGSGARAEATFAGDRTAEGTQAVDMRAVLSSAELPRVGGDPSGSLPIPGPGTATHAGRRRRRRGPAATARRRSREVIAAAAAVAAVALGAGAFAASSIGDSPPVSPATAGSPTTDQPPTSEGAPTTENGPGTEAGPTAGAAPTTTGATPAAGAVSTTATTSGTGAEVVAVTTAATEAPTTTAPAPSTTVPEATTTTSVPDTTTTTAAGDEGGQGEEPAPPGDDGGQGEEPAPPGDPDGTGEDPGAVQGDGEQGRDDDGGDEGEDADPEATGDADGLGVQLDDAARPESDDEADDEVGDEVDDEAGDEVDDEAGDEAGESDDGELTGEGEV